jgi:hypothetical protein
MMTRTPGSARSNRGRAVRPSHHRHLDVEHHDIDPRRPDLVDRDLAVLDLGYDGNLGVGVQNAGEGAPDHR